MPRRDFQAQSPEPAYDPNHIFQGGAKDVQGHSTSIRCSFPDPWVAFIKERVADKAWPEYTTEQHFIRDAVFHRIKWVEKQTDRVTSDYSRTLLVLATMNDELEQLETMRIAHKELLSRIDREGKAALADGNHKALAEIMGNFRERIAEFNFSDTYRHKLYDEIEWWERKLN